MRYPRRRKKLKRKNPKFGVMFSVTILILGAIATLYVINKRALPTLLEITDTNIRAKVNMCMDRTLKNYMAEHNLKSDDFYVKNTDADGKIMSLSVNSVLTNDICASLAAEISRELATLGMERISVPIGMLLDIGILANWGPAYSVRILPQGTATVDYESSFEAAGINQLNFQIWLNISSSAKIVNPLQNQQIDINRKIVLVNTVITGDIPSAYFNFGR